MMLFCVKVEEIAKKRVYWKWMRLRGLNERLVYRSRTKRVVERASGCKTTAGWEY